MRLLSFTTLLVLAASLLPSKVVQADKPKATDHPLHGRIDQLVEARFSQWNVQPSEICSDADFLRRLTLDLTGVIPEEQTAREFLADRSPDKRVALIDKLLASDAFQQHMAVVFDVMLMERRPDNHVKTDEWRDYLAKSFEENTPLDQLIHEILAADGVDEETRPAAKFYLDRNVEKDILVRDIGRLFLGVDLQCAQCHNHPDIDDYKHEYYHGLSVFVAGSKTFRQPDGSTVLQEMVTREVEYVSVFEPENSKKTGPRLLDALMEVPEPVEGEEYVEKPSSKVRAVPKFSLRQLLADKLPSNETPEFSRNLANRLWAMLMGRGLVHPLDMHHSSNPPSHPELLTVLATELSRSKYDLRQFLRELALSKTYQRSSLLPAGVDPNSIPPESYAVANMKSLWPEQLFESLLRATKSQAVLEQQIEQVLMEDAEAYQKLKDDPEKLASVRAEKEAEQRTQFVTLFGSSAGQPEGDFQSSMPQTLFLSNNETILAWIEPCCDNLTEELTAMEDVGQLADVAYFSILSRPPTEEEAKLVREHIEARGTNRREAVIELIWSLIASAEFRINH